MPRHDLMEIEVKPIYSLEGNKMAILTTFDPADAMERYLWADVIRQISSKIAERYVAENYQEIIKYISPEAVATLTAAESAAKIRETLEKKIPERILEVEKTRTEVWQRGVLGGMTRIR